MEKATLSLKSIEPFLAKIEALTNVQKLIICIGTFVFIIGAFAYFSYYPKFKRLDLLSKEFATLSNELEVAIKNAMEIDSYREKLANKQAELNIVTKALPEKKEIPSLVSSISQAGLDSGLEFILFQPNPEITKGFYAEIPVSIKVEGEYHNLAVFFDKVSRLPRIVNIEDIKIVPSNAKAGNKLGTSCTAVTYRFIDLPANVGEQKKKNIK
jgi:type IV pilus assembly protein PilO